MAKVKEGDRVKIVKRAVSAEDRKTGRYFEHMANLTGMVGNVYEDGQVAVMIEKESLSDVSRGVHEDAVKRMREKFLENLSEEAKKQLTPEELNFGANFVHLVQAGDIEKIS